MHGVDLLGSVLRVVPERRPPAIDPRRIRRLLIVKLSSIGDVVHALPVASALKRADPSRRVTWAVEEWTAPLLRDHPAIDRIVVFPTLVKWPSNPIAWYRDLQRALRDLRSEPYDAALDLQGLARSAAVSLASRAPLRIARQGQREGAHLVSFGVPLPETRLHAVDEYLHAAGVLGAAPRPANFALQISAEALAAVSAKLAAHGIDQHTPIVVINAVTARRWKNWRLDAWVEVAEALSDWGRVVLVGSSQQIQPHAEITGRTRRPVTDLTGQTTLAELVAILDRAALHVASDTGTVHVAAALERPVVAVYGPTPASRVGPYGRNHGVVSHGDLCGSWCPIVCLYGRQCLSAATPEEVIAKARAILGRSFPAILASTRT